MNKLVFKHYMLSNNSSMIYKKIRCPYDSLKNRAPQCGKLFTKLGMSEFADRQNKFKLMSLYVKDEICATMIEIKKVCDNVS
jgi:hypothetical protein